jgi:mono/diheme cytochrome c family protein
MKTNRSFMRQVTLSFGLMLGLGAAGAVQADSAGIYNAATLKTANGQQVYASICQGCHMPDGKGAIGAGHYPAFAGNPAAVSAPFLALTVLHGRRNMPSFAERDSPGHKPSMGIVTLTDEQVSSVVNYIRTHFGNHYTDTISTADVTALRKQSH